MSNTETQPRPSFESALSQLEAIVEGLESGNTPLAELVEQYEKGNRLIEICREQLGEAELRIQKVEKSKDGLSAQPMDLPA
jgi:exodeoxyribonuclease VII small subunit